MGKIWLKNPDPSKQCCDCAGKSGPCDSCCSLDIGPYSNIKDAKTALANQTKACLVYTRLNASQIKSLGVTKATNSLKVSEELYDLDAPVPFPTSCGTSYPGNLSWGGDFAVGRDTYTIDLKLTFAGLAMGVRGFNYTVSLSGSISRPGQPTTPFTGFYVKIGGVKYFDGQTVSVGPCFLGGFGSPGGHKDISWVTSPDGPSPVPAYGTNIVVGMSDYYSFFPYYPVYFQSPFGGYPSSVGGDMPTSKFSFSKGEVITVSYSVSASAKANISLSIYFADKNGVQYPIENIQNPSTSGLTSIKTFTVPTAGNYTYTVISNSSVDAATSALDVITTTTVSSLNLLKPCSIRASYYDSNNKLLYLPCVP